MLPGSEQVGVQRQACCLVPAGDMDSAPAAAAAAKATYFIKAERIRHNFAPGGLTDRCTGEPLDAETMVGASCSAMSWLAITRVQPHTILNSSGALTKARHALHMLGRW